MVEFKPTSIGYGVFVNGQPWGYITRGRGLVVKQPNDIAEIFPADLRRISLRIEMEQGFVTCSHCEQRAQPVKMTPKYIEYRCGYCSRHRSVSI
jgi:uncharacterized Zn-finger protein